MLVNPYDQSCVRSSADSAASASTAADSVGADSVGAGSVATGATACSSPASAVGGGRGSFVGVAGGLPCVAAAGCSPEGWAGALFPFVQAAKIRMQNRSAVRFFIVISRVGFWLNGFALSNGRYFVGVPPLFPPPHLYCTQLGRNQTAATSLPTAAKSHYRWCRWVWPWVWLSV